MLAELELDMCWDWDSMGTLVVAKALLHLGEVGQEVRGAWEDQVAHLEVLRCGGKVVQGEDC